MRALDPLDLSGGKKREFLKAGLGTFMLMSSWFPYFLFCFLFLYHLLIPYPFPVISTPPRPSLHLKSQPVPPVATEPLR